MWPNLSLPRLRRLLTDRRGVTSLAFAGSAVILVGAAGLVADASLWYATKRGAQNAADAAAAAGAALAGAGTATTVARDVSGRNGFANGVNATTVAVTEAGSTVTVDVARTVTPGFTGFFGVNTVTVRARAAAVLFESGDVCGLTLTGTLTVTGSATVNAAGCNLASNKRGADSIVIGTGSSTEVTAQGLIAAGACVGCNAAAPRVTVETVRAFAPPATNPLSYLDNKGVGLTSNCMGQNELEPFERSGRMICNNQLRVSGQTVLDLAPGTYVLWNTDFRTQGQSQVRCSTCTGGRGVTIFLTGTPNDIGGITVNAGTAVTLRAPSAGPAEPQAWDNDWRGVLFYRDTRATNNNDVTINGGAASSLSGAMYFPTTSVTINGNSSTAGCTLIVASVMSFSGNGSTSTCQSEFGLRPPTIRQVVFTQ